MKNIIILIASMLLFLSITCSNNKKPSINTLNGVWEVAGRDFSNETRMISKYKWGKADIIPLHSFVFFLNSEEKAFITQNEVFIITTFNFDSSDKIKLTCFLFEGARDKLYTYVFKVLDDTTIEFMRNESSTPLFPARLKKGGEVYP